jgi:hypothetical protein
MLIDTVGGSICISPSILAASVNFNLAFLLIHYIIYGSLSG